MHKPALIGREAYPKNNNPPLDVQRTGLPGSSGGLKVAPLIWRRCQVPSGPLTIRKQKACQFEMAPNLALSAAKEAGLPAPWRNF